MLWVCLLFAFLGPVIGCLLFVMLSAQPNVLTAVIGAGVGMVSSLAAVFLIA
jgi:hypothetical protein